MDKENKQINTRNKDIFNESTNNETKESFQQNSSRYRYSINNSILQYKIGFKIGK